MKIKVLRKVRTDKFTESALCFCMALFFIGGITLIQTIYYDWNLINQNIKENLDTASTLIAISGVIGFSISIIQTLRDKPLFKYKFVSENKDIIFLFFYLILLSIVGFFISYKIGQIPINTKTKVISFDFLYLIPTYLISIFILFAVLMHISLINVVKSMSSFFPKRGKTLK
jgi:hypothetical protein